MSDRPNPLAFLDANVLAKPVTRTLLIYAGNHSDYRITWSQHVEAVMLMSKGMANPPRTPAELHARLGRQHPLTLA